MASIAIGSHKQNGAAAISEGAKYLLTIHAIRVAAHGGFVNGEASRRPAARAGASEPRNCKPLCALSKGWEYGVSSLWDHQGNIGNTRGNVLVGLRKLKTTKIKTFCRRWQKPGRISPWWNQTLLGMPQSIRCC
jgi:hypothetical protein